MKKLLFVAVISLISICNVRSHGKLTEKQQLVQKVIIDMFQALSDRDTDNLKSNCTPDIVVLENGIVWNLDTLTPKNNQNKAITDFNRINTYGNLIFEIVKDKPQVDFYFYVYNNQNKCIKDYLRDSLTSNKI